MNDGTVTLTYNVKLNMTQDDLMKLKGFLSTTNCAYNDCSEFIIDNHIQLNIQDVHNNVYTWMREKYPQLPAQCIIKIYKDVIGAIRSIRKNKHKYAKTPKKQHLSMRLDKRLYAGLSSKGISLTGFEKNKRKTFSFEMYDTVNDMFARYTTSDPLIFVRDGIAFLSIPFNVPQSPTKDDTAIGVDLGLRRFATTSDGLVIDDKAYKARRRRMRYLKRCLKQKGTKSAKRHLKKLKYKERNQSSDFINNTSNTIIRSTSASVIVLEDLKKLKKNTSKTSNGYRRKKHNSRLSQVAIAEFKRVLTYKALLAGKRVETVSPTWTSQTDSRTGKRDGDRKGCRYYCTDGAVLDADWNAAVNIVKRSKHPFSNCTPIDGGLMFLNGRCQSTRHTHNKLEDLSSGVQAAKSLA